MDESDEIARLKQRITDLNCVLEDRERVIRDLKTENLSLKSTVEVREIEIKKLAAVCARDLQRVRAETAAFSKKIAQLEGRPGRPEDAT